MRDAGINDGDLLAVQKTNMATDGQIVIARIGEEVTVKYFKRVGKTIELLPANSEFKPIVVVESENEFQIEGKAVGIIRHLT